MPPYEKAPKKEPKSKSPREIMDGKLKVNDMVISDEYVLAEKGSDGKELSKLLLEHKEDALLIKDGGKVVGLVTQRSILKAIAEGRIKVDLKANDLMTADILEVKEDDTLEEVLPAMYEKQPEAVIVIDKKGQFVGYFSPKDCKLASIKLNFFEE
jgi:predicted transcriptional regulator